MQTIHPKFWKTRAYLRRWRVIEPAPRELTDHIAAFNAEAGRPTNARPCLDTPDDFVRELRAAIADLPVQLLDLLGTRFLGVYLARDLGCSAVADVILDGDTVIGVAIALDVNALEHRGANEWATWEEREPFADDPGVSMTVTIADRADDERRVAMQMLLLHELGHVLVAGRDFLPPWWKSPDASETRTHDFLDIAWQWSADGCAVPRCSRVAALRDRVPFYSRTPLPAIDAQACYRELLDSDFPTLYAIANPYEDFSECLAIYVHTVLMGRPYRLELRCANLPPFLDDADAVAARCARKFAFVASLLGERAALGLKEAVAVAQATAFTTRPTPAAASYGTGSFER